MLSRISRCRRGGAEGLLPLARSALAARCEAAASLSGGGERAADFKSMATTSTSTSSLSARSYLHSRSSSSSSAMERLEAKQMMHGGLLPSCSPSSRSQLLLLRRRRDPASSPPSSSFSTAAPSPRKLDDILKLDSLRGKTGEEIASIWTEVRFSLL